MKRVPVYLTSLFVLILFACTSPDNNVVVPNYTAPTPGSDAGTSNKPTDAGVSNEDACVPEDDTTFCSSTGFECGTVAAFDNCGMARSTSCGDCQIGDVCNGGTCQTVAPDCTPETDAQFCAQYEKNCGSVTKPDNCGQIRTVANCGACVAPSTCTDNICKACVPKTCATIPNACEAQSDGCGGVLNCGVCAAGSGCSAPTNGACAVCTNTQHSCNDICVDESITACGDACTICPAAPAGSYEVCAIRATYTCENLLCPVSSPDTCNNACTNVNTDMNNCGTCGNVCPAATTHCVAGKCA